MCKCFSKAKNKHDMCVVFLFYSFEKLQKTQVKGKITSEILQFSIYNVKVNLELWETAKCKQILEL